MAFVSVKDFTTGLAAKLSTWLVNTDENVTKHGLVDSANGEILGTKTDAANVATDATSLSVMSVIKQVSKSIQALAALIASGAASTGTNGLLVRLSPDGLNANGQQTMANSAPVVLASNHSNVPTKETRSSTSAQTSVVAAASSTVVLAANANRLGATVFNDSTALLYLLLGSGTASNSNYSVQIAAGGYYETPFNYTGALTGIWAAANGNARVTELT